MHDTPTTPDANAANAGTPPAPTTFTQKLWQEWVKPMGTILLVLIVIRSSIIDWNDVPSGSMNPTILEGDRIVVNKLAYGINAPVNGPVIDLPLLPQFKNPLSFLPRYLWAKPQRGDIVTFWNPTPPTLPNGQENPSHGIRMVKRIVALPGETVEVINGRLRILDAQGQEVPIHYDDVQTSPVRFFKSPGGTHTLALDDFIESIAPIEHAVQFTSAMPNYRNVPPVLLKNDPDLGECEYFMVGDNRDNSADSRAYFTNFNGLTVQGKHITGKAKFIALSFDGSFVAPRFHRLFRSFDHATTEDLRENTPIN